MAEYIVLEGARPGHFRAVEDDRGNISSVLYAVGETVVIPDNEVPSIHFQPVDEPARVAYAKHKAHVDTIQEQNKMAARLAQGGLQADVAAKLEMLRLENENLRLQVQLGKPLEPVVKQEPRKEPDTLSEIQNRNDRSGRR